MMISTRGRYALRVLVDLAEHQTDGFIPLKDITARQDISQKYLESIMASLSKAGLVEAAHGKGGGYGLNRAPEDYTLLDILRVTEGDLAPVTCLEQNATPCERALECKTLPVWDKLNVMVQNYLGGVHLSDLI